MPAAMSF